MNHNIENKFTKIKERVVQIAKNQDVSLEYFFSTIGMTSANFRGKAKNTPLNSNAIANIITKYPEVDLYWLLMGEKKNVNENTLNEKRSKYKTLHISCEEKDEIIEMLKSQVKDLKADKEDLRALLKLAQKK